MCLAVLVAGVTLSPRAAVPAESTNVSEPVLQATNSPPTDVDQARLAVQAIEEQLRAATLALEQARKESEAAARRSAEALTDRVAFLERELVNQRARESMAGQKSNSNLVVAAALLAATGVLMMGFSIWFQMRVLNRLAAAIAKQGGSPALLPAPLAFDLAPVAAPPDPRPVEESSRRLLGAVERLEQRIKEFEQTAKAALPTAADAPSPQGGNGNGDGKQTMPAPNVIPVASTNGGGNAAATQERVALLLEKGQSLLSTGQHEKAVLCFDEALALDDAHADALLKKGMALERLERYSEALQFYDRAIGANPRLTLAYLHKAAVCNQMERFDDALRCYEQALRTKQLTETNGSA